MPGVTELVMPTIYAQLRATMDRAIQTAALVPLKMGVFAILSGKEIASPSTPWRASTPRMRAPGVGTVIALQTWEVLLAMNLVSVIRKHSWFVNALKDVLILTMISISENGTPHMCQNVSILAVEKSPSNGYVQVTGVIR
jgi:hypothetical protein